jgi:hypothetical protein
MRGYLFRSDILNKLRISAVVLIGTIIAGSGPILAQTGPAYVQPNAYLNFDCPQLVREARALSKRSAILADLPKGDRGADTSEKTSAVIPWPNAFSIVSGDKSVADKLALMRGQMLAIEDASIRAQCSIQFAKPPA